MSTNYPSGLDSYTAKTDNVDHVNAAHVNNLQDAVTAIEGELGTDPSGASATVKARLDSLDTTVAAKAPLASPTFTGTPVAPTQTAGDASTKLATTSYADVSSAAAAANAGLLIGYGQLAGAPKKPWEPSPTRGPNLWSTSYFYQGATLGSSTTVLNKTLTTVTATAGPANQRLTTRIVLPSGDNTVNRFRVTLTIDATAFSGGSGTPGVIIGARGNGGALTAISGVSDTTVWSTTSAATSFRTSFEVDYATASATHLDVSIYTGTHTSGSITLSNVTVYEVEAIVPPILCAWSATPAAGATFTVAQPVGKNDAGSVLRAHRGFGPDGTNELFLNGLTIYPENSYQSPTQLGNTAIFSQFGPQRSLHVGNNHQIFTVYKADGVTIELRGNDHGGEAGQSGTFTTDHTAYADYGDGNGWTAVTDSPWTHRCWRVKIVSNTKMTRSDQGSPFVLVSSTHYLYADGTMRTDRTNTWQQDQKIAHWFYHMTSINPATNSMSHFSGRLGAGQRVIGEMAYTDLIPPPTVTAVTASTTGGTIPATPTSSGQWRAKVTALSNFGESTASPVTYPRDTTGTTSSVDVTWTGNNSPGGVAPSGYAVYFGVAGYERLVATVSSGTTSYTITDLPNGTAKPMPTRNTAITGLLETNTILDSPVADWSAIYDPHTRVVYSLAVDRDEMLALTGGTGVRGTLQCQASSIAKNYWHANLGGPTGDLPYTVPSGTVHTSRLWYFTYQPADPDAFEREQTIRAANVKNLTSIYTST